MWSYSEFSWEIITHFLITGHKVIVAIPTCWPPSATTSAGLQWLRRYLTPAVGVHCVDLDLDNPDAFRAALAQLNCPGLDTALLFWPISQLPSLAQLDEVGWSDLDDYFGKASFDWAWNQVRVWLLLGPLVSRSRVLFYMTQWVSISNMTTPMPTGHAHRAACAALYAQIRCLSLDFPNAIIVGVHLGLWVNAFISRPTQRLTPLPDRSLVRQTQNSLGMWSFFLLMFVNEPLQGL